MEDAASHIVEIAAKIRERGCVLMLDFDGVLAPIVKNPANARISPATRELLSKCASQMPVAILTGRTLSDIERRVGLGELIYAGSHGLEWKIDGQVNRGELDHNALAVFELARRSLLQYANSFPDLLVEDNELSLAFGYRSLSAGRAAEFRVGANEIADEFVRAGKIRQLDNLFTFEIMPLSQWTKGSCARHIYCLKKNENAVAIYIGDSLTDEDVFRDFATDGITFRVGKSSTSLAQYYFSSQKEIYRFLRDIST